MSAMTHCGRRPGLKNYSIAVLLSTICILDGFVLLSNAHNVAKHTCEFLYIINNSVHCAKFIYYLLLGVYKTQMSLSPRKPLTTPTNHVFLSAQYKFAEDGCLPLLDSPSLFFTKYLRLQKNRSGRKWRIRTQI